MKHALLSLLSTAPAHGYDLRAGLESGFGGMWESVNSGQVYTTLARLERDGLIAGAEPAEGDARGKRTYTLTEDGRDELTKWLDTKSTEAIVGGETFRKVLIAVRTGMVDPRALVDRHRSDALERLAALRRAETVDPERALLSDWAVRRLEADLQWLEHCDEWLAGRTAASADRAPTDAD
jgi:DNA-binding PadR family transcriptional regulator